MRLFLVVVLSVITCALITGSVCAIDWADRFEGEYQDRTYSGTIYHGGIDGRSMKCDNYADWICYQRSKLADQGTISLYVKYWYMASNPRHYIVSNIGEWDEANGFRLYLDYATKKLCYTFYDNNGNQHKIESTSVIELNTWYHIAISFGSNGIALYVNGEQQAYNNSTPVTLSSIRNIFLADNAEGPYVYGSAAYFDHVQFSSIENDSYTIEPTFLLDWTDYLDEDSTCRESSAISYPIGIDKNAAECDTFADWIRYSRSKFADQGTISLYVNYWYIDNSARQYIISSIGETNQANGFRLYLDGIARKLCYTFCDNSGVEHTIYTPDMFVSPNTWYQVAISYGPNGTTLYVNGQQIGHCSTAVTLGDNRDIYLADNTSDSFNYGSAAYFDHLQVSPVEDDAGIVEPILINGSWTDDFEANYIYRTYYDTYEAGGIDGYATGCDNYADWICYPRGRFAYQGTISFYVKYWHIDNSIPKHYIISNIGEWAGVEEGGFRLYMNAEDNNRLCYEFGVVPEAPGTPYYETIKSLNSIQPGEWYHIAISYGQNGMALYVDGQNVASSSTPVYLNDIRDIYLADNAICPYFYGSVAYFDHLQFSTIENDSSITNPTFLNQNYKVYFVKPDGDDTYDGSSWSAAKATIDSALSAAVSGDEVWVAAGTYERITLKEGVRLYGGFAGVEIKKSERRWITNETIIDGGNVGPSVVTALNGTSRSTVIDGFTITNGSFVYGGGIGCQGNASPTITHNKITGNIGQDEGGGIWCDEGSPLIENNLIISNTAEGYGGGGIRVGLGSAEIINNTIAYNTSIASGSGILIWDGSTPILINNIIAFNIYYAQVGVIGSGNPTITYNNVYDDTYGTYSGIPDQTGINGNISTDPLFFGTGDYHLATGSPCIDAGTNTGAPTNDLDGLPRDANPDIGAYEYR